MSQRETAWIGMETSRTIARGIYLIDSDPMATELILARNYGTRESAEKLMALGNLSALGKTAESCRKDLAPNGLETPATDQRISALVTLRGAHLARRVYLMDAAGIWKQCERGLGITGSWKTVRDWPGIDIPGQKGAER